MLLRLAAEVPQVVQLEEVDDGHMHQLLGVESLLEQQPLKAQSRETDRQRGQLRQDSPVLQDRPQVVSAWKAAYLYPDNSQNTAAVSQLFA